MSLTNPGTFRNIWLSPSKEIDRKKSSTISPPPNLKTTTSICNFRNGLVIKQANNIIVFIKKQQLEWNLQWHFLPDNPVDELFCNDTDDLFMTGKESMYMLKEVPGEPRVVVPFSKTYDFIRFFDVINPYSDYIAIVNKSNDLVVQLKNEVISTFEEVSTVTCMYSHSTIPLICLGDDIGTVYFISYKDISAPKLSVKCRPGKEAISQISIEDEYVVVSDITNRIFIGRFCSDKESSFEFLHTFEISSEHSVLKSVPFTLGSNLMIIVLLRENPSTPSGNIFKVYTFNGEIMTLEEEAYSSERNYIMIGVDPSNKLLGLEENGIEFHMLGFQEDQVVVNKIVENLSIKKFAFLVQDNYFISWNCLGQVVILDTTLLKPVFSSMICRNSEDFNFKSVRIMNNQLVFLTLTGKITCYGFEKVPERPKVEVVDHVLLKCSVVINEGKIYYFWEFLG